MNENKEKKMTKRDYFNILLNMEKVKSNTELVDFINHELELLDRKKTAKSDKPTATQIENEKLKIAILENMEDNNYYTVSQLIKIVPECNGLSNQKVANLVRQLYKEDKVNRVEEKGKAFFVKK